MLQGRYFDGRQAEARDIRYALHIGHLREEGEPGAQTLDWDLAGLKVVQRPQHGREAVLGHRDHKDARLYVAAEDYQTFAHLLPKSAHPRITVSTSLRALFFLTVAAALVVGLLWWSVPRLAGPIAANIPQDWEQALGDYVVEYITAKRRHCVARDGQRALERLIFPLKVSARNMPAITLTVVDDDLVNAFAAPGGHILLFRGLIEDARSPEEIAGVVAHEIGHVIRRHPMEGFVRNMFSSLAAQLMFGNVGAAGDLGMFGHMMMELSYSRDVELEADDHAVTLLENANIGTHGLRDFFMRMGKKEPLMRNEAFAYFSTHPEMAGRAERIRVEGEGWQSPINAHEWEALQAICGHTEGGR